MAFDRFMIAPFDAGLETDLKPFLIPDSAWERLDNAYIFRGRVKKRFGSSLTGTGWTDPDVAHLYSRLAIPLTGGAGIGTINAGTATGVLATRGGGAIKKVGQLFTVDNIIYTVVDIAAGPHALLSTDPTASGTYDITTDTYVINAVVADGTQVYFYPAEPVMGIFQYESGAINNAPTIVFDTQFAYRFLSGFWTKIGTAIWHGDDLDKFWAANWNGISSDLTSMFITNFQVANKNGVVVAATDDPLWSYDGATWATFAPKFLTAGAGNIVNTCRIIVPFKDRLLLLNTVESDALGTTNKHFQNRCRFSHNGSPFPANTAWLEPNQTGADGAGWIDAPTEEEIISAGFIKDRLIVYFERSTWELAYTGNQILPFVWQKLNTELGSEATFSLVPFDKVVLVVGSVGIHACNGSNVERIDTKIPTSVFEIKQKDNSASRVVGVRDFYTEMVYWSMPKSNQPADMKYPNKVLVYNYKNLTWSFNDDCITAFGYFEQQEDLTWENIDSTWEESNFLWNSSIIQAQSKQVLAGNQQGYVFIINSSISRNAPVMSITNMSTLPLGYTLLEVIDHTLTVGDYIKIEHTPSISGIYRVDDVSSDTEVLIFGDLLTPYLGGGTVSRVSKMDLLSKQWNPYVDKDFAFHLAKIDFNVDRTTSGEVTVDYSPSYTKLSMLDDASKTGALLGTGILETFPYPLVTLEASQEQLWHPVFFQTDGDSIQIRITMSEDQMTNSSIVESNFELNAMVLYTRKTSTRL